MSSKIPAWSMSRLDVYESCPYRAYLQYVEKVPTPELVPPPGQDEHPLTRGIRVHEAAEYYVTRDIELIDELQNFATAFDVQKSLYQADPAKCVVEQQWAFDESWQTVSWYSQTAWGRLKLDWGFVNDDTFEIVDYKTGKKYPPKHIQQGQLYALVASIRYPEIQNFKIGFWYLDSGDTLEKEYSRTQIQFFKDDFDRRARTMTSATEFPPNSNAYSCRFCPYGEGRDGNKFCEYRFSYSN